MVQKVPKNRAKIKSKKGLGTFFCAKAFFGPNIFEKKNYQKNWIKNVFPRAEPGKTSGGEQKSNLKTADFF